jgi:hypothetical protein
MPYAALLFVLALALAAGHAFRRVLRGREDSRAFAAIVGLAAGLLLLHLALAWLDLLGIPWNAWVVIGAVLAAAMAVRLRFGAARRVPEDRRDQEGAGPARRRDEPLDLGWAGLTGSAMVAFFAVLAASERIAFPDFVYHWGIKGHRYFLARAIDYDFLGREWNLVAHRDYPQLVPEIYALQSMIAGRFSEPALLLWSAVFFAALLVAAREALDAWAVRRDRARVVFAMLALAIAVFAVGHQMAGSVDWIVALALTAALPALIRPPVASGELQLGMLAALAASSKLEGIPLAALLIGAGAVRRVRQALIGGARPSGRAASGDGARAIGSAAVRLALPSIVAVTPWLVQGFRHDLFRDPQGGPFEAGRAAAIAAGVWQALLRPEWHLLPLLLLLVPLLFLRRETRVAGGLVALQLAGYLLRYFTAAFDYQFSVLSSFPRLVFHVFPTVVLGLAAVVDGWAGRPRKSPALGPLL